MVSLRIQEFLDARGLSRTDLSSLTGIAEDTITTYATESISLNESTAQDIRIIASRLSVPAAKLIRPVNKKAGVRLNILEKAKQQGLNLSQISEQSNVHPLLVGFYSTQVLLKEKWEEPQIQEDISRLATVLGTSSTELSVIQDTPLIKLRVDDYLHEKGISLEELSLLNDVPPRFFDLLETQSFDFSLLVRNDDSVLSSLCEFAGCPWPCRCSTS